MATDLRTALKRQAPAPLAVMDVDALYARALGRRRSRRLRWLLSLVVAVAAAVVPIEGALVPGGRPGRLETVRPPRPDRPVTEPRSATTAPVLARSRPSGSPVAASPPAGAKAAAQPGSGRNVGASALSPPTPVPPGRYQYLAHISSSSGGSSDSTGTMTVSPSSGPTQQWALDLPESMGYHDHRSWTYRYGQDGVTQEHFSATTTIDGAPYDSTDCSSRPGSVVLPTGAKPGDHVQITANCKDTINGSSTSTRTGTITDTQDMLVGTQHVTTLVVSWQWTSTSSSGTEQDWVRPNDNLLVQSVVQQDTTSSTGTDHTSAQIYLQNLTPT